MASILVVDDEEGVRSFLADALDSDGHQVAQAADGAEALQRLAAQAFQVVVTDLKMPRVDGLELLRRMRADEIASEVVVLTAHGSVDSAVEAMKLGAFEYLQKPLSGPTELRLLVGRALERYRARLAREVATRDATVRLGYGSPVMATVEQALRKVAATDATVLLLGESGTGKEVAARAVHEWSDRAAGPFAAINCAALSETLLESELFGHEKGAFTGATALRRGRLEAADGGTFLLDEVGELKPALQAKLLRVLQERRFERVGGNRSVACNVRWIAATNRSLEDMMNAGEFREDLYHRLAVFPVRLPALRERREDIPPLSRALLARVAADLGRAELQLDDAAAAALSAGDWPGNARQLANTLERAAILADGTTIGRGELDLASAAAGGAPAAAATNDDAELQSLPTLAQSEKRLIERALQRYDDNRRLVAEHLGIGVRTLYDKIKRYGL